MTEVVAFLVLVVILAVVGRSMYGLTQMATASGTLRPATQRTLNRLPTVVFAVWAAALFVRLYLHASGYALWPFELAIAVVVWLCWVAVVAAVITLREGLLRLTGRAPQSSAVTGADAAGGPDHG